MTDCRAFALVAMLVAVPALEASAQFGGMPGMPGAAGPGGFGAPPPAARPTIPPACARLLTMREEAQKQASAIQAAGERKAAPAEACRLFRVFLNTESKMIRGIEEALTVCGVPPEVPKQMKVGHAKTQQIAKQICDAAAIGPRPAGPSLSDALGAAPVIPDTDASKKGGGTFETLSGSALIR